MSVWGKKRSKIWRAGVAVPDKTPDVCPSADAATWVSNNLGFTPDPSQADVLNATENRLLLLCTRQWGKSTIVAAKALHHALTTPKAFILVASACKRQAKELVLKFNEFAHTVLGEMPKPEGEGFRLPNRARIIPLPQNPDKVRCYSAPSLIIVDEAAFVKDELYDALRPARATSNGAVWLLSTAGEQKGFFHKAWVSRAKGWKLVKVTAAECPRISAEFLAGERIEMGEAKYMREYFCQFRAGRSQFVDESYLEAIFDTNFKALGE
ncbi:MAG: hypothetical protein FJW38_05840 [Acidobacteria bacterium]|nr:hypothetical protein [Acidobacteriota bacterium]